MSSERSSPKDEHYIIVTFIEPAPLHLDPDEAIEACRLALDHLGVEDYDVRWVLERPKEGDL